MEKAYLVNGTFYLFFHETDDGDTDYTIYRTNLDEVDGGQIGGEWEDDLAFIREVLPEPFASAQMIEADEAEALLEKIQKIEWKRSIEYLLNQ